MIQPIADSLNGKKTYITAAITVVFALFGAYIGELDGPQVGELILAAMAMTGLRHAIDKPTYIMPDEE